MSLRASISYLFVRGAAGVMGMVALSLFVRGLGPERYGQFALGIAAAALTSNLLIIPLNTTLARLYGEQDLRGRLLATLAGLVLVISLAFVVLAFIADAAGLSWLASWVLPAAAIFAAAQGALDYAAQTATSALLPGRYSKLLLIRAVGISLLGALAIYLSLGVPGVLLAMALSCVLGVFFSDSGSSLNWRAFDVALLPRVTRFVLPLLLSCALTYVLQWGDRYLLARWVSMADLGRYSALADLIQQALTLLCAGLSSAWYPRVVQAWGGGDREETERLMARYAVMGLAFLLPAGLGLACVLQPIAERLFGAAYAGLPFELPLMLIAASCLAAIKSFYFDVRILLAERVWRQAAGIAVSAIIALLVMRLCLPHWGVSGAAFGLLCGQAAGLVYSILAGRGVLCLRLEWRATLMIVLASAFMLMVLLVWPKGGLLSLVTRVLSGAASYALVLWLCDMDGLRARVRDVLSRALVGRGQGA